MKPNIATTDAEALFRAFVACLIVVSLPIKNAAYVTPAVYLLILWLHGESRIVGRVVVLCSAILMISSIAVLWDHLGGQTVNFPGLWLGLVTYGPLFVVLCETYRRTIDQVTYGKFVRVCAWYILFQSVVGVFQFVATGNSDAVCGTLGLLDGFRQNITIAQVYFTFLIFGMILFLVPVASQRLPRVAIATGVLICVLAQSGHQTIFFVVTLVVCGMSRISHVGTFVRTVAAAAVLSLLMFQIYPETLWMTREWYRKVADTSNSPKRLAYEGAISILEEPKNLLIGTGLGQYSSRAALITSNEYLAVAAAPVYDRQVRLLQRSYCAIHLALRRIRRGQRNRQTLHVCDQSARRVGPCTLHCLARSDLPQCRLVCQAHDRQWRPGPVDWVHHDGRYDFFHALLLY